MAGLLRFVLENFIESLPFCQLQKVICIYIRYWQNVTQCKKLNRQSSMNANVLRSEYAAAKKQTTKTWNRAGTRRNRGLNAML